LARSSAAKSCGNGIDPSLTVAATSGSGAIVAAKGRLESKRAVLLHRQARNITVLIVETQVMDRWRWQLASKKMLYSITLWATAGSLNELVISLD
jgi:hypothetical protein